MTCSCEGALATIRFLVAEKEPHIICLIAVKCSGSFSVPFLVE